jgi:hypothetical protein
MIFLNKSFNLKDELFVYGRSIKIQGKKTLGMLYVQGKAPMRGGAVALVTRGKNL